MKRNFGLGELLSSGLLNVGLLGGGIVSGAAIVMMAAQPAQASPTRITNVQVNSNDAGAEVVMETHNGDRPQVFTVSRGNALVADIINTQLQLDGSNGFVQNNPAPGITSVSVTQLDANSVRVIVTGQSDPPSGEVLTAGNQVVLNVSPIGDIASPPPDASTPAVPPAASDRSTPDSVPLSSAPAFPAPETMAPETTAPETTADASFAPPPQAASEVLVPNPGVMIDGIPVVEPSQTYIPPTLPAPVPPPIGDIATSTIDTSPSEVDLGTTEVVPRLVLRDAPVRDVLSLLARAAGLNVAYVGDTGEQEEEEGEEAAAATDSDVRISLDIENEPVQNVFNYVIRIASLDVNRVGRTIFVGPRLPNSARQVITRTLRLNQVSAGPAVAFLVGLGAETSVTNERLITTVQAAPTTTQGVATTQTQPSVTTQSQETRVEVQRVDYEDSEPLLRGLQVTGDARTNSVTLVGSPRKVEIAAAQLAQLDIRRRQAAINVRVIDVNLLGVDRVSTSFSFGINDTSIITDSGVGVINFGSTSSEDLPARLGVGAEGVDSFISPLRPGNYDFVRNFLAQLRFAVTSGNAKVLTDPTLVVQEGQAAQVQLTQDVITNIIREIETTEGVRTETVEVERTPAGLILDVQVDRVDDNGFVTLSVAPSISAPTATQTINVGLSGGGQTITLLAVRRVSSGQIRIRDGQTLILSGIIQDQDRATVTKVPILGDIPILGALFRSTERRNERQEVIVLLTPHILDDSDTSTFGYRYTPQPETQEYIQQQNIQIP